VWGEVEKKCVEVVRWNGEVEMRYFGKELTFGK